MLMEFTLWNILTFGFTKYSQHRYLSEYLKVHPDKAFPKKFLQDSK